MLYVEFDLGEKPRPSIFKKGSYPIGGVFILLLKGSSILSLVDELPWDFLDNLRCFLG
jgi:hypothetical protein